MLTKVVLVGIVSLCAISALPLDFPKDNSHYVEGKSRYIWMPDDSGTLHLVDLHEPVDTIAASRNGGARNAYWLFTRDNPTTQQILTYNDIDSVKNSNYRANRGTVLIAHGWTNNGGSPVNVQLTAAFLAAMEVNVIVLDWSRTASGDYVTSAAGVPSVGEYAGDFLEWLFAAAGGDWNQLHLVGHSLGAHVVGAAGRRLGGKASRVTGLDPAGPLWGGIGIMARQRLTDTAAQYVEAIHTDGRALGIMDRSADADFYPNGGRHLQPGCSVIGTTGCSHSRAYEFFASSVRDDRFVGKQCSNLRQAERDQCAGIELNMGNGVFDKRGFGIYGLTTGSSWPF